MAKYLVGIDLGTTHTVAAYADLQLLQDGEAPRARLFEIEQLIAPGEIARRSMLPSVRYHPGAQELAERDTALPWDPPDHSLGIVPGIVGELARELGARVPGRLVASAKSWLSHRFVDRTEAILPWGAHEDVSRVSPVDASASYLAHVRAAWNCRFPDDPLESQEIVLTVPASFDEGARALTLEAARLAGLAKPRLIEEPLAACYDWLSRRSDRELSDLLEGVRLALVCDVGGGTTDFTLIKVEPQESGAPRLSRVAVGDHLILGGDNMDLALAHVAEARLMTSGGRLGAAALSQLVQQCRLAKERLLSPGAPERISVTVVGAGSRLVAGARSTELARDEVRQMLVDGFYPQIGADERPQRVRGGIVEFGLPYVADPAVTRHLAAFLERYRHAAAEALGEREGDRSAIPVPDAVLLNGGVFRSELISARMLEVMHAWAGRPVRQLANDSPDLAVARGAVAYGLSRHGHGARIGAGAARSFFLMLDGGKDDRRSAICILPRGAEEGKPVHLEGKLFSLRLGQPVRFHLVSSMSDTPYGAGDLAEVDDASFAPLPPIATVIPREQGPRDSGTRDARRDERLVELTAALTEIGTLDVSCIAADDPDERWRLEFQLRDAGKSLRGATGALHPRFGEAAELVERIYGARRREINPKEVRSLRRDLETVLGERDTWDMGVLRELFGVVLEGARHRRRSADHERVWLNLAGFCLRPGFGFPLDDWRIPQLWSLYGQGVQHKEAQVAAEWWILWRRIAGGLDRSAQETILDDVEAELRPTADRAGRQRPARRPGSENVIRMAGALERIHFARKVQIGEWLLERVKIPAESLQVWWSIGRLGARVPFYGAANNTTPREIAERWVQCALAEDWAQAGGAAFAATLLARMSGDRERDLAETVRRKVADRLRASGASESWILMVERPMQLDEADEKQVFGESLPPGLRLAGN